MTRQHVKLTKQKRKKKRKKGTQPPYVRYDGGAPLGHVEGPPVCASLQISIQTVHSDAPLPWAGAPVFNQEVPLRGHVTLAPLRHPRLVHRHRDEQRFLWAHLGLREVFVRAAVVVRHRGHKVLQQVVAGHHQDGYAEEGHMQDLEASCGSHQLEQVTKCHGCVYDRT